jgi:hypothetical protein
VLVGRFGEVYPFARDRLAVEVYDGGVALRVAEALNGKPPWQRGEAFFCYVFSAAELATIAEVIQARKARRTAGRGLEPSVISTWFRQLRKGYRDGSDQQLQVVHEAHALLLDLLQD